MIEQMVPDMKVFRQSWASTLTGLMWGQWIVLDTGLRTAQAIFQTASAPPGAALSMKDELVNRAVARMKKGLAPPPEIYQAPYRDQIDWSLFSDWARPSDPDMYEGCGHEG